MTFDSYFAWRNEVSMLFERATRSSQINKILQAQTERLEHDAFSLLIKHPVPFTRPKTFLFSTYPTRWVKRYMEKNYLTADPVVKRCAVPGVLFAWSDACGEDEKTFWQDAQDHGLKSGFSCSFMAANRAAGILSISSRKAIKKSVVIREVELKLLLLAELSLATLVRLKDESMRIFENDFSQRELEILKWTAEGKTSVEIALILAISEHTVNFHQKNMQKRFNASNKTQIACYAAAIGLI
ncbi:transcriptional regulator SdiA [Duffyella gerundensis]|uniref:transcriptional regulator SdiA n=1 Tax=Duffyella gerundensis TaxID=1619313 RepID=UPI003FD0777D